MIERKSSFLNFFNKPKHPPYFNGAVKGDAIPKYLQCFKVKSKTFEHPIKQSLFKDFVLKFLDRVTKLEINRLLLGYRRILITLKTLHSIDVHGSKTR